MSMGYDYSWKTALAMHNTKWSIISRKPRLEKKLQEIN